MAQMELVPALYINNSAHAEHGMATSIIESVKKQSSDVLDDSFHGSRTGMLNNNASITVPQPNSSLFFITAQSSGIGVTILRIKFDGTILVQTGTSDGIHTSVSDGNLTITNTVGWQKPYVLLYCG